jgi:hypothetical protein
MRATETREAEQQAISTAAVVQTQTAFQLESQAADAQRQCLDNAAITVLLIVDTCVVIYLMFILVRIHNHNTTKAGSVIAYGPHGNPLILAQNGKAQTIIDPLTNTAALTILDGLGQVAANELPELMLGALAVVYQQAQPSLFKPMAGQPERYDRWKVGQVKHETQPGARPALGKVHQLA